MGGEMLFNHNDKPIINLAAYQQLVESIIRDCQNQVVPVEFSLDKATEILSEKDKQSLGSYEKLGVNDDYILGVTLQKRPDGYTGLSARYDHYYMLFPKDPNALKIISNMHARGFSGVEITKQWVHDLLIKFVVTFPGVFKLRYGDGRSGFDSDIGDITYSEGRDYAVEGWD